MGCVASASPRVHPTRQQRVLIDFDVIDDADPNKEVQPPPIIEIDVVDLLRQSFYAIFQGISKIPKPPSVQPIVCLNSSTLPLVLSTLYLPSGDATNITTPVAAIASFGKGRIVASMQFYDSGTYTSCYVIVRTYNLIIFFSNNHICRSF